MNINVKCLFSSLKNVLNSLYLSIQDSKNDEKLFPLLQTSFAQCFAAFGCHDKCSKMGKHDAGYQRQFL